jgi:tetratricopeptide (TPR) repeat protein
MKRVLLAIAAGAWSTMAAAAEKPLFEPPAAWVKPVEMAPPVQGDDPTPVRFLLIDGQTRLTPQGIDVYSDIAYQLLTPEALAGGNLNLSWSPDTETLIIHHVHIVRDGKVIDVLASQSFSVLRRETNLERSALDGRLTAALQPEGLQVGDIIDFAVTRRHYDPSLQGHSELSGYLAPNLPIERIHLRGVWPSTVTPKWRTTDGMEKFTYVKTSDGGGELTEEMSKVRLPKPPDAAPSRFALPVQYQISDYGTWGDASKTLAPLFVKASTLAPNSLLKAEAARIAASSNDPKFRAAAALHLVQDKVRYVYLGMNLGNFVPADADLTWSRKFGDCKGKTALLLALLHELGIEAEPSLVSTKQGDGLDARLPGLDIFDHVFVRATIGGKVYWLDGTRSGDNDLDQLSMPPYYWTLPVTSAGSDLEPLPIKPLEKPSKETHLSFDATAGLDAPAPVHIEEILRGDDAINMHRDQANTPREDTEKKLREKWRKAYDWIEIKKIGYSFDDATGEEHLTLDGAASMDWPWNDDGSARRYETDGTHLGWKDGFKRPEGQRTDVPYLIDHPVYEKVIETIKLPQQGKGFKLTGADPVDTSAGGFEHKRTARIENDVITVEAGTRSLVREFPADKIVEARATLSALSDVTVYVQAPEKYEASPAEKTIRLARTPETESEFRDRADALFEDGDYDGAIKALDAASRLEPEWAASYNMRCFYRAEANKDLDAALADCNQALKLAPDESSIFDSRGLVYFRQGQLDLALKDYDQAVKLKPEYSSSLYMRGIVKRRLKKGREGDTDIAAAKKLYPGVVADYRKYGITP